MLANLRMPMTVILGRAQLLERRIRAGQIVDAETCLATLVEIEVPIRVMEARLRAVHLQHSPNGVDGTKGCVGAPDTGPVGHPLPG